MSVAAEPQRLDDDAIARIAEGMMGCTLPAIEWTHAAHWASALYIIARRPDLHPPDVMPGFIRQYNEWCGNKNTATSGYHETITQASLSAGLAMLANAASGQPVSETLKRLLASPLGRSDWLLAYWSKERLMSEQARREWVAPDLAPFAFPEFPARED